MQFCFYFEIIAESQEVVKKKKKYKEGLVPLIQIPPSSPTIISSITIAQDQNQNTDIGTVCLYLCVILSHLQIHVTPTAIKSGDSGTPLVVQGLRLHALNVGGLGSIPGQGTRSHRPQLEMLPAATKKHPTLHNEYQRPCMRN